MKFLEFDGVLIRFSAIREIGLAHLRDFENGNDIVGYKIYILTSNKTRHKEVLKDRESAKERFQEIMCLLKAKIKRGVKVENT